MSDCGFFERRGIKTLPKSEWKSVHSEHIDKTKGFDKENFEHPSGTWYWLVCTCGAKLLCDGS